MGKRGRGCVCAGNSRERGKDGNTQNPSNLQPQGDTFSAWGPSAPQRLLCLSCSRVNSE